MKKPTDFAAFVGVDWADQQHAVCLQAAGSQTFEASVLTQQADTLDAWAAELRVRFDGRSVAVCLEQSRGALIYALMKYEFVVLFPLNPKQLAKYREALAPSGPKDDPTDAELLCRFLSQHVGRLRIWRPDDAVTRQLRLLGEARRKWVDQRTALGNQLLEQLKQVYPLALQWLGKHVYAARLLKLLGKYPSQREVQRASPMQLARLLPKQRRVSDDPPLTPATDSRITAIRAARLLVTDEAILAAGRLAVLHLVAMLEQLNQTVADYDEQIAACLNGHPDAALFGGLPGAGEALTPRLVAAFGTDRERYASATEIAQYSGIAPITVRSGKACLVRRRMFCPKYLRQTFHEFARCSTLRSSWAAAYCKMLRSRGHGYHAAIRPLAFKWIRILFRCWKDRAPYDEARYMQQLRRRNAPLLAFIEPPKSATNN